MDVTVTPAAADDLTAWGRNAWDLTDLLGRPMGRIAE